MMRKYPGAGVRKWRSSGLFAIVLEGNMVFPIPFFSRKKEWMELLHRKLQGKSDITAETGVSVQRKEDFLLEPS